MTQEYMCASELSSAEQCAVRNSSWAPDKYALAYRLLAECNDFLGFPSPEENDVEMAAKVISALPGQRLPKSADGSGDVHPTWLLTESWILQGRDPLPIHIAAIAAWIKTGVKA